jgi:Tfp pilus assembly protein PilF
VTLPPGKIPVTAEEKSYISAISALEKISDTASAQIAYRTALSRWPKNQTAQIGMGNIAYRLHDLAQAEQVFRSATTDHPDSVAAFNNLAQILSDQLRYEEALEAAHQAVSLRGALAPIAQETLVEIERRMKK